jgi:hypothetical protein
MTRVGAPWPAMGVLTEEGREGEERGRGGRGWGTIGRGRAAGGGAMGRARSFSCCS